MKANLNLQKRIWYPGNIMFRRIPRHYQVLNIFRYNAQYNSGLSKKKWFQFSWQKNLQDSLFTFSILTRFGTTRLKWSRVSGDLSVSSVIRTIPVIRTPWFFSERSDLNNEDGLFVSCYWFFSFTWWLYSLFSFVTILIGPR